MPNLGEYVGQLLAEITQARVQADLESARIAGMYAGDPLLKHMPIPRFRLPTITLDVPVAVESTDAGSVTTGGTAEGVAVDAVVPAFDRVFPVQLSLARVPLSMDGRERVRRYVVDLSYKLGSGMRATDVAWEVTGAIREPLFMVAAEEGVEKTPVEIFFQGFTPALEKELATGGATASRVGVSANTARLREVGPAELLVRLKLSVTEESMEWSVTTNDDGTETARLIPS